MGGRSRQSISIRLDRRERWLVEALATRWGTTLNGALRRLLREHGAAILAREHGAADSLPTVGSTRPAE